MSESTKLKTSSLNEACISWEEMQLAPRIVWHGGSSKYGRSSYSSSNDRRWLSPFKESSVSLDLRVSSPWNKAISPGRTRGLHPGFSVNISREHPRFFGETGFFCLIETIDFSQLWLVKPPSQENYARCGVGWDTEFVSVVTSFNQNWRNFARKLYFSQVFRKNLQDSRGGAFVDLLASYKPEVSGR